MRTPGDMNTGETMRATLSATQIYAVLPRSTCCVLTSPMLHDDQHFTPADMTKALVTRDTHAIREESHVRRSCIPYSTQFDSR